MSSILGNICCDVTGPRAWNLSYCGKHSKVDANKRYFITLITLRWFALRKQSPQKQYKRGKIKIKDTKIFATTVQYC